MGHGEWGMGHGSRLRQPKGRGMGHGAWGMGQGFANLKVGEWGMGHGAIPILCG
ncbi:hypothetical protein [Microcoleus sp. FACHB-68]|uniref:hypothetical protein n=1 Tax=Microcoleus sp. FACHB-68 TaxID=2692826 RepID=UPI001685F9C9|nr:hypothetical protein [Microcoleus sp. FACHB-68]MBD1940221.1 hypothetical protein [Microcoleus sp. FACHB-68]